MIGEGEGSVVGLDNLAGEGEADAGALFFGGEERDEEIVGIGDAGAGIVDEEEEDGTLEAVLDGDGTLIEAGGFDGIFDEIEESLFEEVGIGGEGERLFWRVEEDGRIIEESGEAGEEIVEGERFGFGRGELGHAGVFADEAAETFSAVLNNLESLAEVGAVLWVGMIDGGDALEAFGEGADGGHGIIEFVSEDAEEPFPCHEFLFAEGLADIDEDKEFVGAAADPVGTAADGEASRPVGEGVRDDGVGGALEGLVEVEFGGVVAEGLGAGQIEEAEGGGIGEVEAAIGIEGEDGGINFLNDLIEEGMGFEGIHAVGGKDIGEAINFVEQLAHGVGGVGLAGFEGEVALAEGGEHIGGGLDGVEKVSLEADGEEKPWGGGEDEDGKEDLGSVAAEEEEGEGGEEAWEAAEDGEQPEALLVVGEAAATGFHGRHGVFITGRSVGGAGRRRSGKGRGRMRPWRRCRRCV